MPARFAGRIAGAQRAMAQAGLDILVVTNRENLIYFTGVTQIECLALLIPKEGEACAVALWLDADYVREHSGLTTRAYFFPRQTLGPTICDYARSFGYTDPRIGFERYFVDFAVYDALRAAFCERNFVGAGDLFYRLRSVKEPEELDLIRRACDAVCKGMDAAMKVVRPGAAGARCACRCRICNAPGRFRRVVLPSPGGFGRADPACAPDRKLKANPGWGSRCSPPRGDMRRILRKNGADRLPLALCLKGRPMSMLCSCAPWSERKQL